MSKNKEVTGHIQWARMLKKLNPYTIRKGLRYFKHYGPKEFWIRLHERFEPEESDCSNESDGRAVFRKNGRQL